MFDLKALPFIFGQRFVVRYFQHKIGYVLAESFGQFGSGDPDIFNVVVQKCGGYNVCVGFGERCGNKIRNFDQMIDVRFAAFTSVI